MKTGEYSDMSGNGAYRVSRPAGCPMLSRDIRASEKHPPGSGGAARTLKSRSGCGGARKTRTAAPL